MPSPTSLQYYPDSQPADNGTSCPDEVSIVIVHSEAPAPVSCPAAVFAHTD